MRHDAPGQSPGDTSGLAETDLEHAPPWLHAQQIDGPGIALTIGWTVRHDAPGQSPGDTSGLAELTDQPGAKRLLASTWRHGEMLG